jgi:hypothetical protein
MSKMTQHGIVADLRQAAKVMADIDIFQTGQSIMTAAAVEIERLRDELVRIQTDRPFVMGFNQGWDAAVDSGEADESTAKKTL